MLKISFSTETNPLNIYITNIFLGQSRISTDSSSQSILFLLNYNNTNHTHLLMHIHMLIQHYIGIFQTKKIRTTTYLIIIKSQQDKSHLPMHIHMLI